MTPPPQACLVPSGAMSEARRDSTSSLQRKKPPWLRLDIPAALPPAAEEPGFFQVGPGRQGPWGCPVQPPHCEPTAQPLRRQAFLRSVSMPAETAHVPSPHHELRRPVLQRQTSITQTIRRYATAIGSATWGLGDRGRHKCPLWVPGLGVEPGSLPPRLSPRSCSPRYPVLLLLWGPTAVHLPACLLPSSTRSLLLCLSHPNALAPEQPTGALWACPHSAPLGSPCCPQGSPTAPVSLSVPAQVPGAGHECVDIRWRVHGL